MEPWSNKISILLRRDTREFTLSLSPRLSPMCMNQGKSIVEQNEKTAVCKPGREVLPETNHAGIWILLLSLELCEN